MNLHDIARVMFETALAAGADPASDTIGRRRVGLVTRDHRVAVENARGILRVS